jgi:hypothetical protein
MTTERLIFRAWEENDAADLICTQNPGHID